MNDFFAPSLPLLLIKTALIFGISWVAGWTVCAKRVFENDFLNWTVRLITGVAFLNICVINASIWGSTGQVGMLGALVALIARVVVHRRRPISSNTATVLNWKRIAVFVAICALSCVNYLLPLILENTSGYYSRAGGDHSTYLALSDYFVSQKLNKKVEISDTIPPRPYWEMNYFIRNRQNLHTGHAQPLTNQYIATPFMALLPGYPEETYTAAVAFYVAIAVWGAVGLVGVLIRSRHRHLAIAACLVAVSNLLIFTASQHAIPFLFATSMMNILIAYFTARITACQWSIWDESTLIGFTLAGGLLLIYPHLFLFWGALMAVVGVVYFRSIRQSLLTVRLGMATVLAALLLTNLGLFITRSLVRSGATGVSNMASAYNAKEMIAVQSGIVDFGMYLVPGLAGKAAWSDLGSSRLPVLVIFALLAIWQARLRSGIALSALVTVYATATAFYSHQGLSYQAMRFSQTAHLMYLALAGAGIAWVCTNRRLYVSIPGLCAVAFAAHAYYVGRLFTLREVAGIIDSHQVEFRGAGHLKLARVLAEESKNFGERKLYWAQTGPPYPALYASDKDLASDHSLIPKGLLELPGGIDAMTFFTHPAQRVVYYFGPGYGVDLAGATLLLRWSSYLMAHGYSYAPHWSIHGGGRFTELWGEVFLTNCLLAIQSPRGSDVVSDRRDGTTTPRWRLDNLAVYDTKVQNAAEIIGDAWNATQYKGDQPYRYLQGRTGALVIWSLKREPARLSTLVYSDQDGSSLSLKSAALKEPLSFEIEHWKGERDRSQGHTIQLDLKEGPNVVLLTPEGDLPVKPALIVWSLNICSGAGDEYCESSPLKALPPGEATVGSNARVSSGGVQVHAGQPVEAAWKGIASPAKDDWIGVFPVGGGDTSRVAFLFTKGGRSGKLSIPLPADIAPGSYELRFFSKGGWAILASSPPFPVLNPNYKKPEKK